jgi:chromosome partitioning protein
MIITPYQDGLKQIVILNPKGGCGKTTLATNLAAYLAHRGPPPMLIDNDPNGYSSRWLERRPRGSCKINGIADCKLTTHGKRVWPSRIPRSTETIIMDTPAALGPREINELTRNADCILVPILPSAFDVHTATRFIAELLLLTQFDRRVAVVANRTRLNTKSLLMLTEVLTELETPTIGVLSNSQNYVHAADAGLSIYELPRHKAKQEVAQMDSVATWVDRVLMKTPEPEPILPAIFPALSFGRQTGGISFAGSARSGKHALDWA